jgi:hypothetical protein
MLKLVASVLDMQDRVNLHHCKFGLWHLADLEVSSATVRFRGKSRHHAERPVHFKHWQAFKMRGSCR